MYCYRVSDICEMDSLFLEGGDSLSMGRHTYLFIFIFDQSTGNPEIQTFGFPTSGFYS